MNSWQIQLMLKISITLLSVLHYCAGDSTVGSAVCKSNVGMFLCSSLISCTYHLTELKKRQLREVLYTFIQKTTRGGKVRRLVMKSIFSSYGYFKDQIPSSWDFSFSFFTPSLSLWHTHTFVFLCILGLYIHFYSSYQLDTQIFSQILAITHLFLTLT